MRFRTEPAVWIEVLRTGLTLAILFGVSLSDEQLAGILAFVGAVAVALTRSRVTPAQ